MNSEQAIEINEFAQYVYKQNVSIGWWDNSNRCLFETLQLVSSEVAEATEGARKSLPDTHLKHKPMLEVELADTLIRVVDTGAHKQLNYYRTDTVIYTYYYGTSIGAMLLYINKNIIEFADSLKYKPGSSLYHYSRLIESIIEVAKALNINHEMLMTTAREKHEYNRTRPDHNRENRAKEHGKKF